MSVETIIQSRRNLIKCQRWVKKGTSVGDRTKSALPPNNGHPRCRTRCPFRANNRSRFPHSITSSVRESTEGGTVRPSSLAVFRLIDNGNLVGNSIGKSAGAAPCSILSTKYAERW